MMMGSILIWLLSFLLLAIGFGGGVLCQPVYDRSLCAAIIRPAAYPCKEYTVVTDDGYVLALQRIPHGRHSVAPSPRPPVLLLHGVFLAGDTWINNSPDQSLGFLLAEEGFDVWIGNVRGTRWSHGHVSLPRSSKAFWDWSWDELAAKDFPTMLELVYNVTRSRIYFVGHSQGTLLALVALNDERVLKMIAAVALLGPIGYLSNATAPFFRTAVRLEIDKALTNAGIFEVNVWRGRSQQKWRLMIYMKHLTSKPTIRVLNQVCAYDVKICRNLLASITGPNCCFDDSRIKDYLNYEPHPTSTKNLEHYFQMARKGTCSKFDYGFAGNLLHYGSFTAPPCDFSKIPNELPMLISYGGKDTLADILDVRLLLGKLPQNTNILYLEEFAHMDFIYGTNAKADLYDKVMEFLRS